MDNLVERSHLVASVGADAVDTVIVRLKLVGSSSLEGRRRERDKSEQNEGKGERKAAERSRTKELEKDRRSWDSKELVEWERELDNAIDCLLVEEEWRDEIAIRIEIESLEQQKGRSEFAS